MLKLKGIAALRRARWSCLALAGFVASCSVNHGAEGGLVAGWNLNQVRDHDLLLEADSGKGILSLAELSGSWALYSGTDLNGIEGWNPGEALGLRGSSLNGAGLVFEFDPMNVPVAWFSFATKRSGTGFSQLRLEVFDGSRWTPFWNGEVTEKWSVASIPIASSILNEMTPRIRLEIDGAMSPQGTIRFDNIRLDAYVVPGPATLGVLALAPLGSRRRHRWNFSLAGR
ncbi:MAG: hypothetical protein MK085_01620 [Phycisphaerales bacterium]|nr:hypothetical protein [Phycisphaerales bacterium]